MNQAQQLRDGIQALGLDIDEAKQAKLLDYAALLQKWNKTYNLTALRDPAQTVSHHLLDSLTLLPYIEHAQTMLDVGSGGGPSCQGGFPCEGFGVVHGLGGLVRNRPSRRRVPRTST